MKNIITILLSALIYPQGFSMNMPTPMTTATPIANMPGAMPTSKPVVNPMPGAAPSMQKMPPATQPTQPIQAPMPGAQTTTPSTAKQSLTKIDINAPEIQKYKQDFDSLSSSLQQLSDLKNSLKTDLQGLDTKLSAAYQQAEDSKKISFEILQQETEEQAKNLLEKVKDNLKKIQDLQHVIQTSFSESFRKKITDIKLLMANITSSIQKLELKTGTMPPAQQPAQPLTSNAPIMKAPPVVQQSTPPAPQAITPVSDESDETKEEVEQLQIPQTFFGMIKAKAVTIIAWLIKQSKRLTDWILTPSDETEVKKKRTITRQQETQTLAMPLMSAPAPSLPNVSSSMNRDDQIKTYITIINSITKIFDERRIEFSQQYHDVKMAYKVIQAKIATCKILSDYLSLQKQEAKVHEIPVWRKLLEHGFSRLIDLIIFFTHYTKIGIVKVYNHFFAPAIHRFTEDVQEKLSDMENA